MDCHGNKLPRNDGKDRQKATANGKDNGNDKDNGKGNGNNKDKTDEKQSGCCHCEPVRVWQSMENKKQQRQRLWIATTFGLAMTATAKAKDERRTTKWETAFIFYGLPRNFFKIPRNDGKGNGNDKTDEKQSGVSSLRTR
jgi:hypothetical protein